MNKSCLLGDNSGSNVDWLIWRNRSQKILHVYSCFYWVIFQVSPQTLCQGSPSPGNTEINQTLSLTLWELWGQEGVRLGGHTVLWEPRGGRWDLRPLWVGASIIERWSGGWDLVLSLPWPRFNPWSGNWDPASHRSQPTTKKRQRRYG